MKRRHIVSLVLFRLLIASPAFCQATVAEVTVDDEVVFAFAQLGYFADRGIVANLLRELPNPNVHVKGESEVEIVVPHELLELLEVRASNLSLATPKLPWLLEAEDRSPKATLKRFRKHGLIELFNNDNTKLLDSPLTQRRDLIERYVAIADQFSKTVAATYAKGLTEAQLIIVAGNLRTLSVELDLEILKALSLSERARVAKLVTCMLPGAIADAKQWNREVALGSSILDAKLGNRSLPSTHDK